MYVIEVWELLVLNSKTVKLIADASNMKKTSKIMIYINKGLLQMKWQQNADEITF